MIILPSMRGRPLKPNITLPVLGAVLWLDASQKSSIFTDNFVTNVVNDNDLVYGWKDLSGNNNNVLQSDINYRPKWRTSANGLNGLSAIDFSETSAKGFGYSNILYSTKKTVFIVHKGLSSTLESRLFMNNADTYTSVGASPNYGADNNLSFVRENVTWVNGSGFSRAYSATVFNITYTNTPSFSATLSRYQTTGTTTIQSISSMGGPPAYGDGFDMPGSYYEMIVYSSTLTSNEILLVNTYLQKKWGTP
jgi:hypothetical protein